MNSLMHALSPRIPHSCIPPSFTHARIQGFGYPRPYSLTHSCAHIPSSFMRGYAPAFTHAAGHSHIQVRSAWTAPLASRSTPAHIAALPPAHARPHPRTHSLGHPPMRAWIQVLRRQVFIYLVIPSGVRACAHARLFPSPPPNLVSSSVPLSPRVGFQTWTLLRSRLALGQASGPLQTFTLERAG